MPVDLWPAVCHTVTCFWIILSKQGIASNKQMHVVKLLKSSFVTKCLRSNPKWISSRSTLAFKKCVFVSKRWSGFCCILFFFETRGNIGCPRFKIIRVSFLLQGSWVLKLYTLDHAYFFMNTLSHLIQSSILFLTQWKLAAWNFFFLIYKVFVKIVASVFSVS